MGLDYLTTKQVAERLGLTESKTRDAAKKHGVEPLKFAGRQMWTTDDLDALHARIEAAENNLCPWCGKHLVTGQVGSIPAPAEEPAPEAE